MLARSELIPVTIAGAFVSGLVLALAHSLRVPLARRLGLSETQSRRLPRFAGMGLVPAAVLAGVAIDRIGVEWVLVAGSLAAALAVAGLALSQRYPAALGVAALLGAAAAMLAVAANVLMPVAAGAVGPVVAVNLGNVFFVLGLLAAPVLGDVLLGRLGFRRTAGLFALFCLTPALAAAQATAELPPSAAASVALDHPLLVAACLTFLLYGPLEGVLGLWTSSYLEGLGYSERRAAWLVTAFWLAFVGGRLLTALALQSGTAPPAVEAGGLVVLVLVTAAALGNLAGTTNRTGAAVRCCWRACAWGRSFRRSSAWSSPATPTASAARWPASCWRAAAWAASSCCRCWTATPAERRCRRPCGCRRWSLSCWRWRRSRSPCCCRRESDIMRWVVRGKGWHWSFRLRLGGHPRPPVSRCNHSPLTRDTSMRILFLGDIVGPAGR